MAYTELKSNRQIKSMNGRLISNLFQLSRFIADDINNCLFLLFLFASISSVFPSFLIPFFRKFHFSPISIP
jgi:hypothetical protein